MDEEPLNNVQMDFYMNPTLIWSQSKIEVALLTCPT